MYIGDKVSGKKPAGMMWLNKSVHLEQWYTATKYRGVHIEKTKFYSRV